MSAPRWESVDSHTADLLSFAAQIESEAASLEWAEFKRALAWVADESGRIDPNDLRETIRGIVAPRRVGAFTHRALTSGLLVWDGGYVTSTDKQGRNAGRPIRAYRLGGSA